MGDGHTQTPTVAFIVGSVRSGTTLLRLMLSAHPEVSPVEEFEFAVAFAREGSWPELASYYEFLEHDRVFQGKPLSIDRTLAYPELVRSFHHQRHQGSVRPIWADVIHSNFHRCPEIWPEARFVHLVRDPRDVARSCVTRGWYGNNYHAAKGWVGAERRWDELCSRVPKEQRIEVRYERLVRDTESELARICGFLGTQYSAAMMNYSRQTRYDAPDPSLVEQWRTKLSLREIRRVENACGELLKQRGYEPAEGPDHETGPVELAWLVCDNRVQRFRNSVRRYGLGLAVQRTLVRFVPQSVRARVRRRVNAIDAAAVK